MKQKIAIFFMTVLSLAAVYGQEEDPFISFDIPSQNLLKFNRFLINPTFSTVREDNSYINLYHRNQWIQFDNSPEVYFGSYSGRIGDRTGLGLGIYQQNLGVITNFGVLANYAYGVRLSPKSNLTFGFNLSFFSSGIDNSDLLPGMPDPALASIEDNSLLSFQPGFNLSLGSFDVGVYGENLVDFNLRTGESVTEFDEKTFSGHLMYTKKFEKATGLLEKGRLSALTRARKQGDRDLNLSGSLILDLPKIGWVQGGYDDFFGLSAGVGFNLTKRLSLGYTIERGINDGIQNLGSTHEITFAYSFQPNLTEDRVELDPLELDKLAILEDEIEEKDEVIAQKDDELAQIKKNLEENNMILAELIIKQDSMERAVNNDIENRFYHLIKSMKKGGQPNNNSALANNNRPNTNANVRNNSSNANKSVTPNNYNNPANNNARNINVAYNPNNSEDFALAAKANNIKQKTVRNLKNVNSGYYLIANVYSEKTNGRLYRDKFVNKLQKDGIDANYFLNTRNNLNYVYLERFDNWQDAIAAYKSDLGNRYHGEMWIMNVDNEDRLRYANNNVNKNNTKENNALASNEGSNKPVVEDKKRIPASTNKPSSYTSNKGRVVNRPINAKEENNKDRVNSPSVIKNKGVANKSTNNKRVNTPIKSTVVPKLNNNTATADLEDKTEEEIERLYSKSTSKRRKKAKKGRVVNIASLDEGYYIITNVFGVPSNADRFIKKLRSKGLDASYFINPENNYRYVYIKKHNSWNSALASYYSNVDNSYFDEMWIMRVNTNYIL
ncbi:type IX secretion system membrane protein PorP/SprF [Flavobacteriaceae bacterium R38]|nr:type IX secretion system membrane protein PorP/SprF [Flavobacteriaceae bacterium R38]